MDVKPTKTPIGLPVLTSVARRSLLCTSSATVRPTDDSGVHLKRQLGLFHGVSIVAGLVIGGGIYITPKSVLIYAHSPGLSLVLWGIGGVVSLLGALTYAEMGVMMPMAGEKYVYLEKMYGPSIAFQYMWMYLLLVRTGGNSIKAILFGRYVLKPFFPDCDIPEYAILLVGTLLACFLTFINCVSVKISARGQTISTVISFLTLGLVCLSGLAYVLQGNDNHFGNSFEGSTTNVANLALALHSTVYTYYGWTALNFLVEELKNPARNLPLSIVISISLTTIFYVFINWTYVAVLGHDGILASQAVAISVTLKTLGPMAWITPVLIAITAMSSYNSGMMVGSRLAFAGARRGHLPEVLALINIKYSTPMTALFLQLVMTCVLLWAVDVYTLLNNLIFALLVFDMLCVFGFVRLRLKEARDVTRTIKLPLVVSIFYLIVVTILVIIPLVTKPLASGVGLLIAIGTGVPYYIVVVMWTNKPKSFNIDRFTRFVQCLLMSALQQEGHET